MSLDGMAQAEQRRIQNLSERIETSNEIAATDREILVEYNDHLHLLSNQYSDHRHEKLLRHVVIMAEEVGGLADALNDRDAAEAILRWINKNYDNEETNRDYRVALRVFGRHMGDGVNDPDDPPESIDWVPSGTSSTYDPAPRPEKMLRWEQDVVPMIEATYNRRDAAAIALQFDAGLRGGEFKDLKVGDISDHKYGLQVTVDGKQGRRTVTLIPSVPHVQQWLEDHPAPEDPNAPLWSKLNTPAGISRTMIDKMFAEPAARASDVDLTDDDGNKRTVNEIKKDLPKPVTLTNFRKSSASHLASKGVSQAHIENHHGWVTGSKVASRYVSVFSDDSDREIAGAYGKEIEDDGEDEQIAPHICPRCDKETPQNKDMCVWCGQGLEPGVAEVAKEMEEALVDKMADTGDEDKRSALKTAWKEMRDSPERRADMVDDLMDDFA